MSVNDAVFFIFFLIPLLIAAYTDLKYLKIYDIVTVPILATGAVAAVYTHRLPDAAAGALFAAGVFLAGCMLDGVGGGDFKLAAGIGVWMGQTKIYCVVIGAALLAFVWGVIKLYKMGCLKERMEVFFKGVYLQVCGVKGAVSMPSLSENDAAKEAVPFGACLAVATLIVVGKSLFS